MIELLESRPGHADWEPVGRFTSQAEALKEMRRLKRQNPNHLYRIG